MPNQGATVIGKSVKITGDVVGSEDLLLEGEVHGSILLADARLTLAPSANVRGNVSAQDIVVQGRLEGDARAPGRVELRASSSMLGNIYASGFSMEENAAFRGQIDPSRAHEAATAAVEAPAEARQGATPATAARTTPLPAMLAAVAARAPQDGKAEQPRKTPLFKDEA